MRLIGDGVVDREGVAGLARRVGYSAAPPHRLLTAELGAGPLALARARRAQTARVLVETTDLRLRRRRVRRRASRASGSSTTPCGRSTRPRPPSCAAAAAARPRTGTVTMRLAVRTPFAGRRAARLPRLPRRCRASRRPSTGWYARTLDLPHGPGTVRLELDDAPATGQTTFVAAEFRLHDLRDISAAVERARRLVDADCDPVAVDDQFLGPGGRTAGPRDPGLRVPGQVDGDETADPDGRRPAGERRRRAHGHRAAGGGVRHAGRDRPAGPDPPVPGRRRPGRARSRPAADAAGPRPRPDRRWPLRSRAVTSTSTAVPTATTYAGRCSTCPASGRGPPTTCAMRVLGDPDVFLPSDLGVRRGLDGSASERRPLVADSDRGDPGGRTRSCTSGTSSMPPTPTRPEGGLTCPGPSPLTVGELRLVGSTAAHRDEFSPSPRASYDGRPRGARDDGQPVLVEAARQLPGLLRPRPHRASTSRWPRSARRSSCASGRRCARSPTARPSTTASSRTASA